MAFDRHIIALTLRAGVYSVIADRIFNSNADIDWSGIEATSPFRDISGPTLYVDEACIISPEDMPKFARSDVARSYIERECEGALLFVIHRAEWESGIPDD